MLLLVGLAGCRLVDQRTFHPDTASPDAAALHRPDLPSLPLLTIGFAFADQDWRPSVAEAVRAAESRKPDVRFEVVTPIPVAAPLPVQDQFAADGRADAEMVARELQSDGVPPDRITLRQQGDPGDPARAVQIYVR